MNTWGMPNQVSPLVPCLHDILFISTLFTCVCNYKLKAGGNGVDYVDGEVKSGFDASFLEDKNGLKQ